MMIFLIVNHYIWIQCVYVVHQQYYLILDNILLFVVFVNFLVINVGLLNFVLIVYIHVLALTVLYVDVFFSLYFLEFVVVILHVVLTFSDLFQ